ncbi:hypothetical protein B0H17DRAFT_1139479 [Mycena rosella]|uniref:Uncharacterized protein n=1 Tax=Mycena rosella TaxID=1033263 RepID=A0AAD7D5D8_MYCRO|nr:hypothetical protein B0H17DRAFT_1139479 [Mycena rosella]
MVGFFLGRQDSRAHKIVASRIMTSSGSMRNALFDATSILAAHFLLQIPSCLLSPPLHRALDNVVESREEEDVQLADMPVSAREGITPYYIISLCHSSNLNGSRSVAIVIPHCCPVFLPPYLALSLSTRVKVKIIKDHQTPNTSILAGASINHGASTLSILVQSLRTSWLTQFKCLEFSVDMW